MEGAFSSSSLAESQAEVRLGREWPRMGRGQVKDAARRGRRRRTSSPAPSWYRRHSRGRRERGPRSLTRMRVLRMPRTACDWHLYTTERAPLCRTPRELAPPAHLVSLPPRPRPPPPLRRCARSAQSAGRGGDASHRRDQWRCGTVRRRRIGREAHARPPPSSSGGP